MRPNKRRGKLYNIRLNQEEDERFKLVADHNNLDVSQMLRTLVARAAHGLGAAPSAAGRAAAAWERAHASFLQTGVLESLGRFIVTQEHVRATATTVDKVIAGARECGESEVSAALVEFRDAVSAFPRLHNKERNVGTREFVRLVSTYAHASLQMFAWASRRAGL